MITEAALLAVGCTLFVNMGLSDAIQETLGFKSRILSCVKCFTFWTVLAYLTFSGARLYEAVSASFILSYLALWLDLGLSALNRKYNELYQQILSTEADQADAGQAGDRKHAKTSKGRSSLSPVRDEKVNDYGNTL